MASPPTGRYSSAPGTTNNIGSGYWGNDITSNTTFYVTKNKGTSANLATIWEIHGQKPITNAVSGAPLKKTPGQAFTIEWGLGQVLPLKKDFSRLFQIGLVGYDQWQVSDSSGSTILGTPASALPFYSAHAIGFQTNFILPPKALNFFFKFYDEYRALARPEGRTIVFGGSWTSPFRSRKLLQSLNRALSQTKESCAWQFQSRRREASDCWRNRDEQMLR